MQFTGEATYGYSKVEYITFTFSDLEIRVTALEKSVLAQATDIANLQETDIGYEQRIEALEDNIVGNYFILDTEHF